MAKFCVRKPLRSHLLCASTNFRPQIRPGLAYKSVCREAKKADKTVVSEWLAKLRSLISWLTPTTRANCFAKCGFFRSPEEVPSEPEEPIQGWERLDAGCTADDFFTADDNLATCGAHTVEDIVEEATCEVPIPAMMAMTQMRATAKNHHRLLKRCMRSTT
ncbi:hypothetical protein HPB52_004301 [Rhipicephalus sanguineus]|uniref:Uncharacterized protein n=1 Tax=Rhipicephalus sanguineus TaxID=34632 RepID=A0A9D4QHN3_RHISA|nr:hypothetical protein HPB52_004301 [Rhipicephalus sanguineus]